MAGPGAVSTSKQLVGIQKAVAEHVYGLPKAAVTARNTQRLSCALEDAPADLRLRINVFLRAMHTFHVDVRTVRTSSL